MEDTVGPFAPKGTIHEPKRKFIAFDRFESGFNSLYRDDSIELFVSPAVEALDFLQSGTLSSDMRPSILAPMPFGISIRSERPTY